MNLIENITILWADDEIDLLKPHIIFLEEKGYKIITANNGVTALDLLDKYAVDLVFLDENMPGLSGLETLVQLKNIRPNLPVVMITKSEEESIMEDAIGSKISDYLIKPVNPNQILLSIKKNIDKQKLVSQKTTSAYQQEFAKISIDLNSELNFDGWVEIFRKITFWELELANSQEPSMKQILEMQKNEANAQFFKFIKNNYKQWINDPDSSPLLSHNLFKSKVAPFLSEQKTVFFIVIDNLRYDQWKVIEPLVLQYFRVEEEVLYSSILPTSTQYSRNAIFSGLTPLEIQEQHKDFWLDDNEEGGKNNYEFELLKAQLNRLKLRHIKTSYNKITNIENGRKLVQSFNNLMANDLNTIVYNFVDMLSHSRTDMKVIKELTEGDNAYRSLTLSWFEHSPLLEMMKIIAENKCKIVLTTDHGTIMVKKPSKVLGDKHISSNLRYKQGKNMKYNSKEVFEMEHPREFNLPTVNLSSKYIFAKEDYFFAYPNNYNHYVNHYKETYQHGGVSLEEMIIPLVSLNSK